MLLGIYSEIFFHNSSFNDFCLNVPGHVNKISNKKIHIISKQSNVFYLKSDFKEL